MKKGIAMFIVACVFLQIVIAQPDSSSLPPVPQIDEDLPQIEIQEESDGNFFTNIFSSEQNETGESSSTILIWIVILAIVVLIVLIVVIVLVKRKRQVGSNIQIITAQ